MGLEIQRCPFVFRPSQLRLLDFGFVQIPVSTPSLVDLCQRAPSSRQRQENDPRSHADARDFLDFLDHPPVLVCLTEAPNRMAAHPLRTLVLLAVQDNDEAQPVRLPWLAKTLNIPSDIYQLALPTAEQFMSSSQSVLPDGTVGNPGIQSLQTRDRHYSAMEDLLVVMGVGSGRMVMVNLLPSWIQRHLKNVEPEKPQKGDIRELGFLDQISAVLPIGGLNWLIGTQDAMLFHLSVKVVDSKCSLELEVLPTPSGETDGVLHQPRLSPVSCLSGLNCGASLRFFLGSHLASSQVLSYRKRGAEGLGCRFEIMQVIEHLGPCLDVLAADIESTGTPQLMVSTGIGDNGSVRAIRGALRLHRLHELEVAGLLNIFSVSRGLTLFSKTYASVLFLTIASGRTFLVQVARVTPDNGPEIRISGLDCSCFCQSEETLAVASFDDYILQVLRGKVLLVRVEDESFIPLTPFVPPTRITMAAEWEKGVILALSCQRILPVYFGDGALIAGVPLEASFDVHCLQVSGCYLSAACFESNQVAVWRLPMLDAPWQSALLEFSLETALSDRLTSLTSPLAITGVHLDIDSGSIQGNHFLLVSTAEGVLFYAPLSDCESHLVPGAFQRTPLGTSPIKVTRIHVARDKRGSVVCAPALLVTGDVPTVLFSESAGQLSQCVLSTTEAVRLVNCLQVDVDQYLLVWTGHSQRLTFSTIDMLQRLHMQTAMVGFTPDKLAQHESSRSLLVCGVRETGPDDTESSGGNCLLALDFPTKTTRAVFNLPAPETPSAILTLTVPVHKLTGGSLDPEETVEIVVLGCTYAFSDPTTSQKGNVRIIRYFPDVPAHFSVLHEAQVDGAVYALCATADFTLVVGYGNKLRLFSLTLEPLVTSTCYTQVLCLAQASGSIAVGDMLRSVGVLRTLASNSADLPRPSVSLEEVARDPCSACCLALAFSDDDTLLFADEYKNVFVLRNRFNVAESVEERSKLQTIGMFHVGYQVNRLLALDVTAEINQEADFPGILIGRRRVCWVSAEGAMGVFLTIPRETDFLQLTLLQESLESVLAPVADLSRRKWRGARQEVRQFSQQGVVDGDFLEKILDLPPQTVANLWTIVQASPLNTFPSMEAIIVEVERLRTEHSR
ncbi:MAG: uncharacterized protein KVP18_003503 [Porospora cf. gigantea A]|nr:MAG: hypothetical protein KVP18_003503 [Porospora cf. gigantea A]